MWELADSFDILSDGTCIGTFLNEGIVDGVRIQLRSETLGGSAWATATARFKQYPPTVYNGVYGHRVEDDGLYCSVKAVFAPAIADPEGRYFAKVAGGDWGHSAWVRSEFWMYDSDGPAGYGLDTALVQNCASRADPPDKECL